MKEFSLKMFFKAYEADMKTWLQFCVDNEITVEDAMQIITQDYPKYLART